MSHHVLKLTIKSQYRVFMENLVKFAKNINTQIMCSHGLYGDYLSCIFRTTAITYTLLFFV